METTVHVTSLWNFDFYASGNKLTQQKRQMTSMEVNIPLFLKPKPNSPNSFFTFWSSQQIKMSHSIHMPSIQIDTKRLKLVIQHQIVLLCKPYKMHMNATFGAIFKQKMS